MDFQESAKILFENIEIFSKRNAASERQRQICVSELIDSLLSHDASKDTESLYARFCNAIPQATDQDKGSFCLALTKAPHHSLIFGERSLFASEEATAPGSHGRISLVRNRYNEEALRVFSKAVTNVKPSYPSSFADACEDVFDNRCEFCIIPVENSHDGMLSGFYSMLDRYELKICAACEIETDDPSEIIRYALVGKNLPSIFSKSSCWNFEFSVAAETGQFPEDILHIASVFQAKLLKINSLPVLYDDGLHRFYFTFRIHENDVAAFDLYLQQEHTRYTGIGFYPMLNQAD